MPNSTGAIVVPIVNTAPLLKSSCRRNAPQRAAPNSSRLDEFCVVSDTGGHLACGSAALTVALGFFTKASLVLTGASNEIQHIPPADWEFHHEIRVQTQRLGY